MKRILLFWLILPSLALSTVLTPAECERQIHSDAEWLKNFFLHVNEQQRFYLQDNTYGILTPQNEIHQMLNNSNVSSYSYYSHFPMNIFFGYGLRGNQSMAKVHGLPTAIFYCVKVFKKGREFLDICCLCDDSDSTNDRSKNKEAIIRVLEHPNVRRRLFPSHSDL